MLEKIDEDEIAMLNETLEKSRNKPSNEEFKIMTSKSLQLNLKYVDRILNQNVYHKQYILYRNYPEVKIDKIVIEDEAQKRTLGGRLAFK